nr:diguanylate cyclase [Spirochaeta sp.]
MGINKFKYIVNTSKDFITLINKDYIYEIVNDSYCRQINKKREAIVNRSVAEVWGDERFSGKIKKYLDQCFSGQEVSYIEKFKFGSFEKYMHVSYYPYIENDKITHALVFSHDITKISEIESKLTNYEYRDPLTGLFNRRSLDIILEKEIEKAKLSRSEKLRALLFINLGNLAKVNQTYGHDTGDLLIENSGLRIKKILRNCDFIFRFEGKELTAILTEVARNTDVARVAQKICDEVSMPYRYKKDDIFITCKIGISIYPVS